MSVDTWRHVVTRGRHVVTRRCHVVTRGRHVAFHMATRFLTRPDRAVNSTQPLFWRWFGVGQRWWYETLSFPSEIFKSLSFRLDRLCHLAILCLGRNMLILWHHLKLLNNLHLIDLISLKEDLVYPVCAESLSLILSFHILNLVCYGNVFVVLRHEHVVMNPTFQLNEASPTPLFIRSKISLTGFPAQSVWSSNTDVLDLPCLLVLITDTSQSRQHVDTSLIHRESCKSPTAVLFDDDTGRIFHSSL
ncbi:hypothetical protein Tco_0340056 [Tanacetum coccineum]